MSAPRVHTGPAQVPRRSWSAGHIASSAVWRITETVGTEAIAFLVFMALARRLAPASFGAVALAGSFLSLLQAGLTYGFTEALIQRAAADERHYRAVFALNLLAAFTLMLVVFALAWPLGWALDRHDLPLILGALAPTLLFRGLCAPMLAALRRGLHLRPIALGTLLSVTIGGLLGVFLAQRGAGHWALVAQQWSVELVSFCCLTWAAPIKPWQLRWSTASLRELVPVALPVLGAQLLSNAARRLDTVALGAYLSDREVGIYFLVYRLVFAAQMVTQQGFGEVVMVVLSSLSSDLQRYREGLLRALRITTYAGCFAFGLLSAAGPWLVPLVFGEHWRTAGEPLRVLAGLSASGAIVSTAGVVLVAGGSAAAFSRLAVGTALVQLLAAFAAARWGLTAVAWAVGIAQFAAAISAISLIRIRYHVPRAKLAAVLLAIGAVYVTALGASELVSRSTAALAGQVLAAFAFALVMALGALLVLRHDYAALKRRG